MDNADKSLRKFVEVVIAPKIEADALEYLQLHKNLRVIEHDINELDFHHDYRYLNGTLLTQDTDDLLYDKMDSVTAINFEADKNKDLVEFGLRAIRSIKSNSIVIVRRINGSIQMLGMGAGQPNRLVATKLAIEKCKENLRRDNPGISDQEISKALGDTILISDAFFPFEDNVELAAAEGIRKIVQPGGSIRDKQVFETCDRLGVSMLLTGIRHFKH